MLAALLTAIALASPPPVETVVLLVQGSGVCAGAFVDDQGTIATAYHCVAPGGRPRVTTIDGREAIGRVTRVDVAMDLALVSAPELAGSPWLLLAAEQPRPGDVVRVLGHPYGVKEPKGFMEGTLRWALSEGVVSAIGPNAVQFTAPVNPGNSGGPVINEDGELVGVVSRRLSGDGMGFAGRSVGVQNLVDGQGRGFGPLGGTLGLQTLVALEGSAEGTPAIGMRLSASLRDRVVFSASYAFALTGRWNTVRFGGAKWHEMEGRVGLRQRFLRGSWTSHVEVYGGVASVITLEESERIAYTRDTAIVPMVGGAVSLGGTVLDLALVPTGDGWSMRLQTEVRWPGTFWMF